MYLIQRSYVKAMKMKMMMICISIFIQFSRDCGSVVKTAASGKDTQMICISVNQRETRQHVIHFVFVAASFYCFRRGCQLCRWSFSTVQDTFMHIVPHAVGLKSSRMRSQPQLCVCGQITQDSC